MRWPSAAALAAAVALPAQALDYKATLEAEGRVFFEQSGTPVPPAAAATLEFFQNWDGDRQRINGEIFARYDKEDSARTHDDIRELYWQVIGDAFEFRLGARRVFWGVTESRHLVDVINQTDLVEDVDGDAKLGAPMMNVASINDWGVIDLYLLPYQRARTFPGPDGRPRLPFPVNPNEARYESPQGPHNLDAAVRYTGSFGPFDVGVSWFDGTAREPHLLPCVKRGFSYMGETFDTENGPNCDLDSLSFNSGVPDPLLPLLQAGGFAPTDQEARAEITKGIVLVPYYDRLRQVSVDAQVVHGSLALKFEGLRRSRADRATYAAVGGFEYNIGDVPLLNADVGVLGEAMWDQYDEEINVLYNDELFAGLRLSFNDEASTQVLAGVSGQRKDFKGRYGGVEAQRRLGNDWRLGVKARLFAEPPEEPSVSFLEHQDFVTISLERFF